MASPELKCDLAGWDALTKKASVGQFLGAGLAGAGAMALSHFAKPMAQNLMAKAPGMAQQAAQMGHTAGQSVGRAIGTGAQHVGQMAQQAWQKVQPAMQGALDKAKGWATGAAQKVGLTPRPAPPMSAMTNSAFHGLNQNVQAGARSEAAQAPGAQAAAAAQARLHSPSPAPVDVNTYSAAGQQGHGAQQARALGYTARTPHQLQAQRGRAAAAANPMPAAPGVAPAGANAPTNRYAAEIPFDPPTLVKRADDYEEPSYAPAAVLGAGAGIVARNGLGDAGGEAMNAFKQMLKGRPGGRFAPHGPTFGANPRRIRPGAGLSALAGAGVFAGGDWLARRLSETD